MTQAVEILKSMKRLVETKHDKTRDFKKQTGRKIIGYTCPYVPIEIISAAGALPVWVLGNTGTVTEAGGYVQGYFCRYMRNLFDQGLQGVYDYLDGIVVPRVCDAMQSFYEHWVRYIATPYKWFLQHPFVTSASSALNYLTTELTAFRESLEEYTGSQISNDDLRSAINMYNTNRSLLRQLHDLQRSNKVPISGTELLYVLVSGLIMPIEEHNKLLHELLQGLPVRRDAPKGKHRLMVIRGCLAEDAIPWLQEIERLGGIIVTDETCSGTERFSQDIPTEGDPLSAIALRYLRGVRCTEYSPMEPLFKHVLRTAKDYRVQGAIFLLEKYCDPYSLAYPDLRRALEEQRIPSLLIETGEIEMPLGQIRTRTQAFFEMIGG